MGQVTKDSRLHVPRAGAGQGCREDRDPAGAGEGLIKSPLAGWRECGEDGRAVWATLWSFYSHRPGSSSLIPGHTPRGKNTTPTQNFVHKCSRQLGEGRCADCAISCAATVILKLKQMKHQYPG